MSKRNPTKPIKLADYRERKELEGSIPVELDDGHIFRIPAPEIWPDEFYKKTEAARRDGGGYDLDQMARDMVGDDAEYNRFLANGGSAALFHSLLKDGHDIDLGESPASSPS